MIYLLLDSMLTKIFMTFIIISLLVILSYTQYDKISHLINLAIGSSFNHMKDIKDSTIKTISSQIDKTSTNVSKNMDGLVESKINQVVKNTEKLNPIPKLDSSLKITK